MQTCLVYTLYCKSLLHVFPFNLVYLHFSRCSYCCRCRYVLNFLLLNSQFTHSRTMRDAYSLVFVPLHRVFTNNFTSDEWLILLFFVKLPIAGAKRIERDASAVLLTENRIHRKKSLFVFLSVATWTQRALANVLKTTAHRPKTKSKSQRPQSEK